MAGFMRNATPIRPYFGVVAAGDVSHYIPPFAPIANSPSFSAIVLSRNAL
jgi:hypothetical protein